MKKPILFNRFKNAFKLLPLFSALVISFTIQAQCVITGISPSVSICGNSMTMVSVTAAGTGLSYLWNNGNTTDSFNTSVSGTYKVTVTGSCGIAAVSNPIVVTKVNCALDFDGDGDFTYMASPITTQIDNITMETWINWGGTSGNRQIIAYNGNPASNGYGLILNNSDNIAIQVGGSTFLNSTYTPTIGVWTHIAVTRDNGTWNLYINGASESLSSNLANPTTPSASFTLGASAFGLYDYKGKIDEFRFWTRALSEVEISTNTSRTAIGTENGLLSYYNFDQGLAQGNNTSEPALFDCTSPAENNSFFGFSLTGTTSNFVISPYASVGNWLGPLPTIVGITTVPAIGICSGSSFTITSTVIGSAISYQWYYENFSLQFAIPNATLPGLAFTNVNTSYNGTYYVVVTNSAGSVTSAGINFNVGCNNALAFDGVNDNAIYTTTVVGNDNITFEAWVNITSLTGSNQLLFNNGHTSLNGFGLYLPSGTTNLNILLGGIIAVPTGYSLPLNTWTHIALTRKNGTWGLIVNNSVTGFSNATSPNPFNGSSRFSIGSNQGGTEVFNGLIDEVRVWNRPLSNAEILLNINKKLTGTENGLVGYYDFNHGIAGLNNAPVTSITDRNSPTQNIPLANFAMNGNISNFVASPITLAGTWMGQTASIVGISASNSTVCSGGMIIFNSTLVGTPTVSYQWLRNGSPVIGANANSLTLSGVVSSTTGTYSLRASNILGTVTSTNLAISLVGTNLIAQPVSQTICGGALASFTISATGVQLYLWSNGATTPTMNTSLTGSYRVTITGACGSIISSNATLATTLGISISTHPASQTICGSSLANISVNSSGSGLTYLWNTGQTTAGFNTSILGNYMVTVSGACGTPQVSNVANVSSAQSLSFVLHPINWIACQGELVTMNVSATGTGQLTYIWSNGTLGNTLNSTTVGGFIRATVTGFCGTAVSLGAIINRYSLPVFVTQPTSQTVCGANALILSSATGAGPLIYKWNSGQNTESISVNQTGNYRVTVTGYCGATISNLASISLGAVNIITQPQPNAICGSGLASFMVSATGSNIKYLWNTGATTSGINTSVIGSYMVTVSGACNTVVSNTVNLTVGVNTQILTQPQGGTYCEGSTATIFVSATGSNLRYLWSFGSAFANNSVPASLSNAGNQNVTVTGSCGVVVSNAANFVINPKPIIITTASNLKVCYGETATLSASGANTLVWQPANISGSQITVGGTNTGVAIITVTGTNGNFCSSSAFVTVTTLSQIFTTTDFQVVEICFKDTLIFIGANSTINGISNGYFNPSIAGLGMKSVNNIFETADGCKFEKPSGILVINCTTTGINENILYSSISIAPNPTSSNGEVSIKSSEIIEQINLVNLSGRLVFSTTPKSQNATIKLANITHGLYLIEVLTTKEKIVRKLVVE